MNPCSQAGCFNADVRLYKIALRRQLVLLCQPCAASLGALFGEFGMRPVERRSTDVPVLHERRRSFRPAWLSRGLAKVLDHGRAA